jgi:hypothetical protein
VGRTKSAIIAANLIVISLVSLVAIGFALPAPGMAQNARTPAPVVPKAPATYYDPYLEVTQASSVHCGARDVPVAVVNGRIFAQYNSKAANFPEGDVKPDGTFVAKSPVANTTFTGQIKPDGTMTGTLHNEGCEFKITRMEPVSKMDRSKIDARIAGRPH